MWNDQAGATDDMTLGGARGWVGTALVATPPRGGVGLQAQATEGRFRADVLGDCRGACGGGGGDRVDGGGVRGGRPAFLWIIAGVMKNKRKNVAGRARDLSQRDTACPKLSTRQANSLLRVPFGIP